MNFPNEITGTFNRDITLGSGSLRVYKDNVLFLTFGTTDINVSGNAFTIDVTNLFPDNGTYYINFDTGLFVSVLGETIEGVYNTTDWSFVIQDGEYESTEYSNEYLIN